MSESVAVAAGSFSNVVLVRKAGTPNIEEHSWFAPGVGLIRREGRGSAVTYTTELVSYDVK